MDCAARALGEERTPFSWTNALNFDLFDCFSCPVEPLRKDFHFDEERSSSIFTDSESLAIYSVRSRSLYFSDTDFRFDSGAVSGRFRSIEVLFSTFRSNFRSIYHFTSYSRISFDQTLVELVLVCADLRHGTSDIHEKSLVKTMISRSTVCCMSIWYRCCMIWDLGPRSRRWVRCLVGYFSGGIPGAGQGGRTVRGEILGEPLELESSL